MRYGLTLALLGAAVLAAPVVEARDHGKHRRDARVERHADAQPPYAAGDRRYKQLRKAHKRHRHAHHRAYRHAARHRGHHRHHYRPRYRHHEYAYRSHDYRRSFRRAHRHHAGHYHRGHYHDYCHHYCLEALALGLVVSELFYDGY